MSQNAAHREGTDPAAAVETGIATSGAVSGRGTASDPWIVTVRPGLVLKVPFALTAASVELRGDDLYLRVGDQLVVIKGYGPALDTGHPPVILDAAGDSLGFGAPRLGADSPVTLTDAPASPADKTPDNSGSPRSGSPADANSAHIDGTLLRAFDDPVTFARPEATILGTGADQGDGSGGPEIGSHAPAILPGFTIPEFSGVREAAFFAPHQASSAPPIVPPFHAVDDASGTVVGAASGNLIAGIGGGTDIEIGAGITSVTGAGGPVAVTAGGVDVAGQYGTLHVAADGSVSYQRNTTDVADFAALPTDAKDVFSYTLTNGDGRVDSATLTLSLMPGLTVTGDTVGTGKDEALVMAAGSHGALSGAGGEDRLIGNSGDDVLSGGADNDYLAPGAGNDVLDGGSGDDVLDLGANLTSADRIDGGGGSDVLLLDGDYSAGVTFGAATVVNVETIRLADGNSYVFVLDDASNSTGLTVDGSSLTGSYSLNLDGSAETSAPLTATGGAGDDTLTAGGGADTLSGGAGNDTFNLGANLTAADRIDGGADFDTLTLSGDYSAGLSLDAATVINVEAITLMAGNSYTLVLADETNASGLSVDGTALGVGDKLALDGSAETSAPLTATGGAGDDALVGGAGDNVLSGGGGNDSLTAGTGIDTLSGGSGNDTFVMAGNLTAADKIDGGADIDTVELDGDYAAGLTFGVATVQNVEVIALAMGNDYTLTLDDATNTAGLTVDGSALAAGNHLVLDGSAETASGLTAIGGAGNDVLTGGAGNDTLTGNAGDDTLTAGAGNDVVAGGAGNDLIDLGGNLTAADRIDGGADSDTVLLDGDYSARITFNATTLVNVETVLLADGNSYNFALDDASNSNGLTVDGSALTGSHSLSLDGSAETSAPLTATGGAGSDALVGGAGDDVLTGNAGDDTLTAGAGTDTLSGGAGNDTLNLGANLTAADRIDGGADFDTLTLSGDYSAGLTLGATTVVNVEAITLAAGNSYTLVLADGTNASGLTVDGTALGVGDKLALDGSGETSAPLTAKGGAGDDVLIGGAGDDALSGGGGNDTLTAGAGIDTLNGGSGNDTIVMAGNLTAADTIDGGADVDTVELDGDYAPGLVFAATTLQNVEAIALGAGHDYKLTLDDATNTAGLTVDGSALGAGNTLSLDGAAETASALTGKGGAGSDILIGGAGNDILSGNTGDDTLKAGAGNDVLSGGAGNDILNLGANLTAADQIDGGADTDTVTLAGDYAAGVSFTATTMINVESVLLADGNSYKFVLDDASNSSSLTVDGSSLTGANSLVLDGSAETSAPLTATGGAGNDVLTGGAGDDVLTGNAGDDTLTAGAGTDALSGGAGNDTLALGANLTAADRIDGGADFDTLTLSGDYSAGLTFAAATVTNVEAIALATGHSYKLILADATNAAGLSVDGTTLGVADHLNLDGSAESSAPLTATGGAGDDILVGGGGDDVLSGGGGNDSLAGGSGTDVLAGGSGNDSFVMAGYLAPADKIDGGSGSDVVSLAGDYGGGLVFGAATMVNVETLTLAAGNDYKLTLNDATNSAGLTVDGSGLAAGNAVTLDGSAETASALTATGGAGNDVLIGGVGNDTLTGNAGDDTLTAGTGNDVLIGGAGNDLINLGANLTAADKIDGGADTDTVTLAGDYSAGITFAATTMVNVENLVLAAGNSYKLTLNDATDTSTLTIDGSALAAGQVLTVNGAAETASPLIALGGAGNDTLTGGSGNDVLTGGAGNDILTGNNGDDVLTAGSGNDTLAGGSGNDVLDLGANLTAADAIDGGANTDTLKLDGDYAAGVVFGAATVTNVEAIAVGAGHDYKLTLSDASNTAGLTVDASALGSGNIITLDGSAETASALTATGGAGNDVLAGGAGSDKLSGGGGDDTLTAGAGTDTLTGGSGNDSFIFGANLTAADQIDGGADYDILRLSGNYAAGVTFAATTLVNVEEIDLASGNSYKFTLNDANDTSALTIDGSLLASGQVLTVNGAAETASPLLMIGGAGNDVLTGGAGNDVLTAGSGNDTLAGGNGNDVFNLGANLTAADAIDGGANTDTLKLDGDYSAGLVFAAATMKNVETVTLASGHDYKLTLNDASNTAGLTVDASALGSGNVLTLDGSAETASALSATGGGGNDKITGGAGADMLNGGGGDDVLTPGTGNDTLTGGTGNDTFVLGANFTAADSIDGGADFDILTLSGNYAAGVIFGATTLANVEEIDLATGNSYKFTLNDATDTTSLTINGSALAATQSLTVNGAAETGSALILTGGAGNDVFTAGGGSDTLTGGAGNDSFAMGANLTAADKIDGGSGTDTLTLSGNYAAGITFTATTLVNVESLTLTAGSSYKLTLDDATNSTGLTVTGAALIVGQTLILDGSAETSAALTATGGADNDTLIGGAGNDVLTGNNGDDLLIAGAGNDTLSGGNGNDVLDLGANLTSADAVDGGANTDTLKLNGDYSAGLVFGATTATNIEAITLAAGHDYKLTLNNATNAAGLTVDASALGSGNALTLDGSAETASALIATGGSGNDRITGGAGADKLDGGAGDDVLTPGSGNDTLTGGTGNDTFVLGANFTAADAIDGGADHDILTLAGNYAAGIAFGATTLVNVEEIDLASGNSYNFTLNDATDTSSLTIDGSLLAVGQALTVNGAAETGSALILTGGAGNDVFTGGAGTDTLSGGAGNDILTGNNGDDVMTAGAGNDTLAGGNGNDVFLLGANLTAADAIDGGANTDTLKLDGDYSGGLTFGAATVKNVETFSLAAGHDYKFTLNDATNTAGLTVDAGALGSGNVLTLDGSAETASALTATGGSGNDTIIGGAGADKLDGGAGDDVLIGGNGTNTLIAGSGNDTITGGTGADTIVMAGNLTAADKIDGAAGADTVTLAGDYSAGVVLAATTMVNVETITVADGNNYKLTLNDATNAAGLNVNAAALSSGFSLTLDGSAETSAALTATGGAGNDTITGGTGNDILTAGAGEDTISGGGGNDTIALAGNLDAGDAIDGGPGTDTLTLSGNYSAGVSFGATTVLNIETISVAAGGSYTLVLNDATNAGALTVTGATLGIGDVLNLDGTAETTGTLTATGGAGNDVLRGGAGNDSLTGNAGDDTLSGGGGNDTITAGAGNDTIDGGSGNDSIVMAANLNAGDRIDGGIGTDTVSLAGDYSAGVTFNATTLVNVETINLTAGNSYALVLDDASNSTGLTVNGATLAAANFLNLDDSAETASPLVATGGAGNDVLRGGGGNDTLTAGAGTDTLAGGGGDDTLVLAANLTAVDTLDGGSGTDTLTLSGNYAAGLVFGATTLINIETITLAAGNSYNFTLDDANNSAGLTVNASALAAANFLTLDGSAETAAALTATGGAGNDTLQGGAGADNLSGGTGNDILTGNGGDDILTAGAGNDTLSGGGGNDLFVLAGNLTAADQIDGGIGTDTLSLNGNYAAGITFGATTLTNVETIALVDGNSYKFTLHDATNSAGLTIDGSLLTGARTLTLDGSAETSAGLTATGGTGNDALTGGTGGDHLNGGAGNDTLIGNGGADVLFGGAGNDTLTGGTGSDTFSFSLPDAGKDKVNDFKLAEGDVLEFTNVLDGPGSDIQDLINAGVTAVGSAGNCVVSWNAGASTVTLVGVGGTVTSVSDLATLLGAQLHVSH